MEHNPVIDRVKTSPTMLLNQRAKALAREGKSIVNLTTGELDFPTPERVKTAAIKALHDNKTYYTETAGIPELRAKIAEVATRRYGREFSPSQVMVTAGAKQALFNIFYSLLTPTDEVLLLAPYWGSYNEIALVCQATPVVVQSTFEQGYIPALADIEKALSSKTRILMLNSPNNPTGAILPKEWLLGLFQILKKYPRVMVVTDDIYEHLIYDNKPFYSFAMLNECPMERFVIVHGASKTYSMTGWRVGWSISHSDLVSMMVTVQSQCTSNVTSFCQYAALEALHEVPGEIPAMVEKMQKRRDKIYSLLSAIPKLQVFNPPGAFYFFMNVSPWITPEVNDAELAKRLLENHGLATVPGSAFGVEKHLRITFGASDIALEEGVKRLNKGLAL